MLGVWGWKDGGNLVRTDFHCDGLELKEMKRVARIWVLSCRVEAIGDEDMKKAFVEAIDTACPRLSEWVMPAQLYISSLNSWILFFSRLFPDLTALKPSIASMLPGRESEIPRSSSLDLLSDSMTSKIDASRRGKD